MNPVSLRCWTARPLSCELFKSGKPVLPDRVFCELRAKALAEDLNATPGLLMPMRRCTHDRQRAL